MNKHLEKRRDVGRFTKYGTVKGGLCEQWHKDRLAREQGMQLAIDYTLRVKAIKESPAGWYKVVRIPHRQSLRDIQQRCGDDGSREMGYLRMVQSILPPLKAKGKKFRMSHLNAIAHKAAGFDPVTGAVQSDAVYQQKKKDGYFEATGE